MRYRGPLSLLLMLACLGCTITHPATSAPRPGTKPSTGLPAAIAAANATRVVSQHGQPTQLTGKVKIISDNGGDIISDNGGGILSNNGSSLVGNSGGGYRLAATRAEALLADAEIRLYDAAGQLLVDDAGKPLSAKSDGKGGYTLQAVLPSENLVLRAPLFNGGELSAMLASPKPGPRQQDLGTASSLGAAYVLTTFVKGDQKVFDKLPASEASNLEAVLAAAQDLLKAAPSYKPADLVALADQLRGQAPAVERKLEDIKVLLLGQADLGNGRRATLVPLSTMSGLALDAKGDLLIAENAFGRVRRVGQDGVLTTVVDSFHGEVKRNFRRLQDLAVAPDGSLVVACRGDYKVYRVDPQGQITTVAGTGANAHGAPGGPANQTAMLPYSVAVGKDGTVYLGEARGTADTSAETSRLLAVAPDGVLREVPVGGLAQPYARFQAVEAAPDGTLYFLYQASSDDTDSVLYRLPPGGAPQKLLGGLQLGEAGDLARGADGTLYVSEPARRTLTAVAPDGSHHVLDAPGVATPAGLVAGADGTLYVADTGSGRVRARYPDGHWEVLAGADATTQAGFADLPVNAPGGVALDDQGRLLVAEGGSSTIKRFDGQSFQVVVGTTAGDGGDGGLATAAQLTSPGGIAFGQGKLWIVDIDNRRIRVVGPDGIINTAVGGIDGEVDKDGLGPVPAHQFPVRHALGIALTPDGRPVWTDLGEHRLFWLRPDGQCQRVLGGKGLPAPPPEGAPALEAAPTAPTGLAFDAAGNLYVADAFNTQIYKVTGLGTPDARITPFAGQPLATTLNLLANGLPKDDGKQAKDAVLAGPGGLCFDATGNLYVGELGTLGMASVAPLFGGIAGDVLLGVPPTGPRIRKIAPDGTITTVAGPGGKVYQDPGADDALALPAGIVIAPDGRMVIMDSAANLIRFLPAGSY